MTAVAPVVINGNGLWVGWPGIHLEDPNEPIPESDPNDITPTAGLKSKKVSAPAFRKTMEHMSLHVLLPMCQLINSKATIKKIICVCAIQIHLAVYFVLQKKKRELLSPLLHKQNIFFGTGLPTHRDIGATFRVNKRKMLFVA